MKKKLVTVLLAILFVIPTGFAANSNSKVILAAPHPIRQMLQNYVNQKNDRRSGIFNNRLARRKARQARRKAHRQAILLDRGRIVNSLPESGIGNY
jgi:hypothetical protein